MIQEHGPAETVDVEVVFLVRLIFEFLELTTSTPFQRSEAAGCVSKDSRFISLLHSFKHERKAAVTYGSSKGLLSSGYMSNAERKAPIANLLQTK